MKSVVKKIFKSRPLRHQPQRLVHDELTSMFKKFDFYDSWLNKEGKGFKNRYKTEVINGDRVIIDEASELMWQPGGSEHDMPYDQAQEYVKEICTKGYAGYNDWRLPTLEEAMSLLEPEKKEELYIDTDLFDKTQRWIWTCDLQKIGVGAWVVLYSKGKCSYRGLYSGLYVRLVRDL